MKIPANVKIGDILKREIDPLLWMDQIFIGKAVQDVRVIEVLNDRVVVDTTETDEEKENMIIAGAIISGHSHLINRKPDISSLKWEYSRETGEIINAGAITSRII